MTFEQGYFRKLNFTKAQVEQYLRNARRDLNIAQEDPHLEVRFTYCYQALIKIAIALVAKEGYKVRSIPGHHIKLLTKAGELLKDPDILVVGDAMRTKRNEDFYGEGILVTEKEVTDYLEFVRSALDKAERFIQNKL